MLTDERGDERKGIEIEVESRKEGV